MISWMAGCSSETKTTATSTGKADTSKRGVTVFKSDPISLKSTAQLVANLLKQDVLEKVARKSSLGGYFLVDVFRVELPQRGVVLWHCYNPTQEHSLPQLFVAVEQVIAYDSVNPPTVPAATTLAVPLETYKYPHSSNSQSAVLVSIQTQKTKPTAPKPTTTYISRDLVEKYNEKFNELMQSVEILTDSLYCKYSHAFFLDNKAYKNFIARDPVYVRYYFGVAWDTAHKPNYFRPILAGADGQGSTIHKKGPVNNDDPFLQKSVPPPPEQ
jgi:hypothetical protein